MEKSILHILVIWSKAKDYKNDIIEDLRKDFSVLKVFQAHWDKDKFLQNYMIFYAHSQYHLSPNAYRELLQGKVEHCGDDDFTVVILRDDHPHFETRMTSSGERKVNTRMFDKKTQYRALTGGGHKIHSSDDAWETNHDLTLMFGLNTEDFCKVYTLDGGEEAFSQNCMGVGGYSSIEEFFYVLNNTIRYVVMRNHECIPDQYTVEGHGDIDLLCENKNWMAYLTAAKKIYPEPYRVYHTIMIGGVEVPFDFRFIGDNYYDQPWQEHILTNRVLQKKLFYTPNTIDQYYSLLYHAYIQKYEVKGDYHPKLELYANKIGIIYKPELEDILNQLDCFLCDNSYEYVRPNDKSVIYNQHSIQMSKYALRQGQLLKRLYALGNGESFTSRVYEKKDSFIKIGTPWLINNEYCYLCRAKTLDNVPRIIRYENLSKHESLIEISRVKGCDFYSFFKDINHQRSSYVRAFVIGCLKLLISLAENDIAHRDFLPSNMIIEEGKKEKCVVGLIDFAWATPLSKAIENRPYNLAGPFVSKDNVTDSYSLATLLMFYWYDLSYICFISRLLRQISNQDLNNKELLINKYKKILFYAKIIISPYDEWRLLCRRHLRIGWTKKALIRLLKG